MQIWHVGRQGHPSFNPKGDFVSASALRCEIRHTRDASYNTSTFVTPRALEIEESVEVVGDYRRSAELAKEANFDGVEIHGANAYLINQLLQSVTNKRPDNNGGSFENRTHLFLVIVEADKTVFPSYRIGVRLSPNGEFGGMGSEDNFEIFTYTSSLLNSNSASARFLDNPGVYLVINNGVEITRHACSHEQELACSTRLWRRKHPASIASEKPGTACRFNRSDVVNLEFTTHDEGDLT